MTCPCGLGAFESCCGPIIAGTPAPTAALLMRSRYAAYVRGAIDHVITTHVAATRAQIDIEAVTRWSRETTWQGLEVRATERGGPDDTTGTVEFIARGITNGTPFAQHERSRFERIDGRWYYVDGVIIREPAKRAVTTGRNDQCPCGSGKKYKRCHGA